MVTLNVSGSIPPPVCYSSADPTMDKMIRQLIVLSSKVAVLEAERPRATRVETQNPASEVCGLPSGVKAPAPPSFHVASDGDTVKNFADALNTCFELVSMRDLV